MQENEFEQQLKKLMEELDVTPSDSVWDKVKRRLVKKRRRKLPFFFLLSFGLLTAGYFIFHANQKQIQPSSILTGNKNNSKVKNDSIALQNSTSLLQKQTKKDINSANAGESYLKGKSHPVIFIANNKTLNEERIAVKKSSLLEKNYNDNPKQQIKVQIEKENNDSITKANEQLYKNSPVIKQSTALNNSAKQIISDSTFKNDTLFKPDSIAIENKKDASLKKYSQHSYKTSNWQWGFIALYGQSNVVGSLTDFKNSLPQYSNDPGTVAGGNNDTVFHNKHPFISANAYQIGATIQKKISKNIYLSSGLNYTHLSIKNNIGKKIDSAINIPGYNNSYTISGYYKPDSSAAFINKYNFIELPFYFQQDFFHKKQFSVAYNAGFSVRYLLVSRALIYDQYNNIYFFNNDLLRKTQFNFIAGLNVKINTGKNSAFYLGPQFSYSFSNFLKNNSGNNFHFIHYGLQAGLLLYKK